MKTTKHIYIIFRMDDYSAISNTNLELKILEIFQKKKVRITFGIIPFVCAGDQKKPSKQNLIPLTCEKREILKTKIESGVLDIALHGYSHQVNSSKEPSEFAGLDYDSQIEKLTKGKDALEELTGTVVKTFIPPWNKYDKNTLQALEALHFTTLSAGWKGTVNKKSKIRFIPATCDLNLLPDAVRDARAASDDQPLIVVLFHHYDFIELDDKRGNVSLQKLSDLLDSLISEKDLRIISINQASENIHDLSANRFFILDQWRSTERFLPNVFREKKPVLFYHEVDVLPKTRLKVCIYHAIIMALFIVGAFTIAFLYFPISQVFAKTITYGCVLFTLGVFLYVFKNRKFSPKEFKASSAAIGTCVGFLSGYLML